MFESCKAEAQRLHLGKEFMLGFHLISYKLGHIKWYNT